MTMYCLDTDTWSFLARSATPGLRLRLSACPKDKIIVVEMVRAELLFGVVRHPKRPELEARIEAMLAPYKRLPFGGDAAIHYSNIRFALEKAGTPIGPNDLIIAACARAANAVLVTHNTREFKRVPGLKVEDWTKE
jgi:tRNA(fMet)-specific endonuclease VapC